MDLISNLSFNLLYIDPSSVTIIASSVTAIVLAIGASAIIIWRKLKKKVEKTFKIDPNKGKDVEDELVLTDMEKEDTSDEND